MSYHPLALLRLPNYYQEHALSTSTLRHDSFPIQPAKLKDLRGGTVNETPISSAAILQERPRARRDAVLLNASARTFVAGNVQSMVDGWERARS